MPTSVTIQPLPRLTMPLVGKLTSTDDSLVKFEVPLALQTLYTLGRDPNRCNVIFECDFVSGIHLGIQSTLSASGFDVSVFDHGSSNGTFVDSHAIAAHTSRQLVHGAMITIGNGGSQGIIEGKFTQFAVGSFDSLYDCGKELGRGGFGEVYACRKRAVGKQYAAKKITINNASLIGEDVYVERECEISTSYRHDYLVAVYEILKEPTAIYMIMDKAEYGNLQTFIQDNKTVLEPLTKAMAKDATDALKFLHSKGIAHRDIKPCNILIFSLNPFITKIGDFGLAKPVSTDMTMVGTPPFMALEIRYGKAPYGFPVDSWGLGCVIFNMLAGTRPFEDRHDEVPQKDRWRPRYNLLPKEVSPQAKQVIAGLLIVDPGQRMTLRDLGRSPWLKYTRRLAKK
ncbi:hypothetical protein QCA50_018322 [Cerrena zonata]|uniref:Kinase-like protein n=1 Tax=Cerrena zonata TaxID=2478898 RepID=A0AAW0FI81_9APHY